jgi:hypothetical protein
VSNLSSLENKIAVITGAAGAIGRESVRVFQERGATVVGVDIQGDCDADLFLMADLTVPHPGDRRRIRQEERTDQCNQPRPGRDTPARRAVRPSSEGPPPDPRALRAFRPPRGDRRSGSIPRQRRRPSHARDTQSVNQRSPVFREPRLLAQPQWHAHERVDVIGEADAMISISYVCARFLIAHEYG